MTTPGLDVLASCLKRYKCDFCGLRDGNALVYDYEGYGAEETTRTSFWACRECLEASA